MTEHEVMYLTNLNNRTHGWVCDCIDWIINKACGKKGHCKHIRQVLKQK